MARKKLGEFLLEVGLIDEFQLRAALGEQKRFGKPLGRILVEMGMITEEDLVTVLSHQLNLPVVQLQYRSIAPEVVEMLDIDFCQRNCCIAFNFEESGKFLDVAMADPTNQEVYDYIRIQTRCNVRPFLEASTAIDAAIERYQRRLSNPLAAPEDYDIDIEVDNQVDPVMYWAGERVLDLEEGAKTSGTYQQVPTAHNALPTHDTRQATNHPTAPASRPMPTPASQPHTYQAQRSALVSSPAQAPNAFKENGLQNASSAPRGSPSPSEAILQQELMRLNQIVTKHSELITKLIEILVRKGICQHKDFM